MATKSDPRIAYWNKRLGKPEEAEPGKTIAKYLRFFVPISPPDEEGWSWGKAEHEGYPARLEKGLAPLNLPAPIIISVRRTRHFLESLAFQIQDYFRFGSFYRDTSSEGVDFFGLVGEFVEENLKRNMVQRAFSRRLCETFGIVSEEFHHAMDQDEGIQATLIRMGEGLEGTPFAGVFYLIDEAFLATAARLISAVEKGDQEETQKLGSLLELYGIGIVPVELFHGKLIVLEA